MSFAARRSGPHMTVEEFLDWDDGTDTRYELIDGQPIAMAPPLQVHGEIVNAAGAELRARQRPGCRVVAESGIRPVHRDDTFYSADLAVVCGPRQAGARYSDPVLVVEVLSPSTSRHDRITKLSDYRDMPSVREILLLHSDSIRAEVWRRANSGWVVEDVRGPRGELRLEAIEGVIPLAAIYGDIDFAEEVPASRD